MISTDLVQPKNLVCQWEGFSIRYQTAGTKGIPMVLIHGFGSSCEHWRQNITVLAQTNRVYALDLIGFGQSAKPEPDKQITYNFETWGHQVSTFVREVVGEPAFLVGNSIGGVVALQAAVNTPDLSLGTILLNCALRQIHDRKVATQPLPRRLGRPLLKKLLKNKALVRWLFAKIARPGAIQNFLQQAYGNKDAVTEELVEILLQPARDPGAADVFWAFINNFTGPLPEDLLPQLSCPALILWGTADRWEPIALGRQLREFPAVKEFIALEGVGHCPQDEVPEQVNPLLQDWVARYASITPTS